MSDFSIGDVVMLKSGGPVMTVTKIEENSTGREKIWCVWFDSKGVRQTSNFPPEALEKIDDNEPLEPIIG
ncbi:MAG: DUF2158 domain-containing protein [Alphaproteobacteria bacterium]|nr:MAG: DUF2158 domain-containing protein [Alphaproteobacteria bacterium]